MATTNFTGTQLAPFCYGRIDNAVTTAGRVIVRGTGSEVHVNVTGTDCVLQMTAASTTPFTFRLDGVLQSDPTLSGTSNGTATLFSGLTDTVHLVSLSLKTANQGTGNWFPTGTNALSVTGAVPAIAADTAYGPFLVARAGYKVASTWFDDATAVSSENPEFSVNQFQSVPPLTNSPVADLVVRVRGRADSVWGLVNTNNSAKFISLEKDGVFVSSQSVTKNGFGWAQFGPGLDDGSEHDWAIVAGSTSFTQVDVIMLGGTVGAISTTIPTRRSVIVAIGDSITASVDGGLPNQGFGTGTSTGGDGALAYPYLLAKLLGKDAIAIGRSGTVCLVGAQQVANDLQQVTRSGANITHLVVHYGRNDTVLATVTANYTILLQQALAVPSFTGKIVAVTVPEIYGFSGTGNTQVNPGIRAAVAAVPSSRIVLVEGAAWTGITANDGTHYDTAGHALYAANLYASGAMADISSGSSSGGGGGGVIGTDRALQHGGYWYGPKRGRF